jgi:hypothetical protein
LIANLTRSVDDKTPTLYESWSYHSHTEACLSFEQQQLGTSWETNVVRAAFEGVPLRSGIMADYTFVPQRQSLDLENGNYDGRNNTSLFHLDNNPIS